MALAMCGCGSSAVQERLSRSAGMPWPADTVLRAGSLPGALVGPLAVLSVDANRLLVSDAVSSRLLLIDLSAGTSVPVGDRHYRPAAPLFLKRLSDSTVVAARPNGFEVVSLVTGRYASAEAPRSPWDDGAVGSFAVRDKDGLAVMAPAAASLFYPTLSHSESATTSLEVFRWGERPRYFGPPIVGHSARYSASLRHWSAVAGWHGDTAAIVNLYTAQKCTYRVDSLSMVSATGCASLGQAFKPRPVEDEPLPSRQVVIQPQLRDALELPDGRLVVLRYLTYIWNSWKPWDHTGGHFRGLMAIELLDSSGSLLFSAPLPTDEWRGLALTSDSLGVLVFGPGDGENPALPVLLRYKVPRV